MKNLIIVLALATTSCALPAALAGRSTAQLTTPGIAALHAQEVGKTLDIIRDFAVDAEATKNLSTATMLKVVRWHKSAVMIIDQTPDGWKATVLAGLVQLKVTLGVSERTLLGPYIDAAILVIKGVA